MYIHTYYTSILLLIIFAKLKYISVKEKGEESKGTRDSKDLQRDQARGKFVKATKDRSGS